MARVYADLVRKGRIALDAVPKKIRADVENILNVTRRMSEFRFTSTTLAWNR